MQMNLLGLSASLACFGLAACGGSDGKNYQETLKGDAVWYYPTSQNILIHLTEPRDEYLLINDISEFGYSRELKGRILAHKFDSVSISVEAYDQEYTETPEHNGRTAWVNIGFNTAELTNKDLPVGVAMGMSLNQVVFGTRAELTSTFETTDAIELNPIPVSGQYVFNFFRGSRHIAGP